LRVLANPQDEQAWARVLRELTEGVGATTIERLMTAARVRPEKCGVLADSNWILETATGAPKARLVEYIDKYNALRSQLGDLTVSEIVDKAFVASGLENLYGTPQDDETRDRLENLRQFTTGAWERNQQQPELRLTDFLSDLALIADIDELEERADRLPLMTIHAAKGLEFPIVFVAGLEENLLPHARSVDSTEALDEERRLLYVAMTRAKDRLYLSYAETRPMNGRLEFQSPSRFLSDIDAAKLRGAGVPQRPAQRYISNEELEGGDSWRRVVSAPRAGIKLARPTNTVEFRIGDVVEHAEFGVGTVTAKSGDLDTLKVRVAFSGFGSKLLAVKFANLKKLS